MTKSQITRPMLAEKVEHESQIRFPCLVTPKLDGIRCLKVDGKAVSRKFKPIPNHYVRGLVEQLPDGVDGELICPDSDFNTTQSLIMTEEGKPDFSYYVFDYVKHSLHLPYRHRMAELAKLDLPLFVNRLLPVRIDNLVELLEKEKFYLGLGYEGIITRLPSGPYKCGRSTLTEGYLLKFKRFEDSEATIIGMIESLENTNEAKVDALGLTERSHHNAGKVPKGTLGAFQCKDLITGIEFEIGTGVGLTKELRQLIWDTKENYINQVIRYKYHNVGLKDKPRFPSFQGFRNTLDMS